MIAELTFDQPDGFATPVYHWPAPSEPRAVVHIVHGMAEHAARYAETAAALNAAGLEVYAHDHRGHGRSVKEPGDEGFFAEDDGWNLAVADVHRLSQHLAGEHPGLPLILLAHSMGSFMAQQLLTEHGDTWAGVALSGSNGPVGPLGTMGRFIARIERRRLGKRGRSKLIHNLSFGAYNKAFKPARTEFDWLSRDEAIVDAYVADPLCGFVCTTQFWFDMLGGLTRLHAAERLARIPKGLPIYLLAGALDPVSNATKGLDKLLGLYAKQGLERVTHRFYPEGRHEILNETNREEVRTDLLAWIDGVLG